MNEEENVGLLYEAICRAMRPLGATYEIIMVDDGSTDQTYSILASLAQKDPHLTVIKFRRNFGQSAAMAAGFEHASGEVIITMDGDLQNDPADIPRLLEKLDDGYDIVSGWRKNRQDKLLIRKVPSKIANRLIRSLTGVRIHDTGCSLKAYRREVIRRISLYGEMHRFIPALGRIEGAKVGEIVVSHHARRYGRSKYNLTRTFKVIMDLMTLNMLLKYIANPLHLFGILGLIFTAAGVITFGVMVANLAIGLELSEVNVLLALTFLLGASGVQFLLYGLVANMVVKTGHRPLSRLNHLINS
jgi:glycosyltransferase involved in cell wall biosynthesis